MFKEVFNFLVGMQGANRPLTFYKAGDPTPIVGADTIPAAPSQVFTDPAGPEETVGEGRRFVVIAEQVMAMLGRAPQRGDRIYDWNLKGIMTVTIVHEMTDLGGSVMGFKISVED